MQVPNKNSEQSSPSVQACNKAKKNVSLNIKVETEKPVMKPQQIDKKVKKDKSAASAPTDGSVGKRTTHNDVTEDSDPEFNSKWLPMLGLESDNFFTVLVKKCKFHSKKEKRNLCLFVRSAKEVAHEGQMSDTISVSRAQKIQTKLYNASTAIQRKWYMVQAVLFFIV